MGRCEYGVGDACGVGKGGSRGGGRAESYREGGDEHAAFGVPVYLTRGVGEGWDVQTGGEVVPDQVCDAVDFSTKSSGVVFVAGEGEVDGIGRRWGGWVFDVGKSLRFQVCSALEDSLSSGILWIDLDCLKAEYVRPIVAC
jgi:hypothetical protein